MAPHVARRLVGAGHGRLLPACFLGGGAFLVGADVVARTVMAPQELRLGVMTAVVGAPFFLLLLLRQRRVEARMSPLLEAVGLVVTHGALRALDGAGLTLSPGEILGVLGPNGSGKSTLLRVLLGAQHPAGQRAPVRHAAL